MRNVVLDSYAALAFLFAEEGADVVVALFEQAAGADQPLYIAAPNWTEIAYISERKVGRDKWNAARLRLLSLPLEVVPVDQGLAELAAEIKSPHRMSLGDSFAAALAKQKKADLYTGDPEFKAVEKEIKIVWI